MQTILARILAVALAATPLMALAGDSPGLLGSDDAIVNTGYTLYHTHCARCHGDDASGGALDTGLSTIPTKDLTRLAARSDGTFPFWRLYEVISGSELLPAHGSRHMPMWGQDLQSTPDLDPDNAAAVVRGRILAIMAYLATLQTE